MAQAISVVALVALTATIMTSSEQARAQPHPERVPSPGRNLASVDDSLAVSQNPANLSLMPGADMRWLWLRSGNDSPSPARGHIISFASSLPFGLGTGLRLDLVRPPENALPPVDAPYSWLSWGLAFGSKDTALGLSINHLFSSNPRLDGPTTLTLGWTARPKSYLALGAVAHNVNAPTTAAGVQVDRRYVLGTAIRPTGTRAFELGLEAHFLSPTGVIPPIDQDIAPSATLGLDIPYVGRLRGDAIVYDLDSSNRSYAATAMLDIAYSYMTATGGAVWGDALGGKGGAGFVTGLSISSWREPGIPSPKQALRIRIEHTPSDREHVSFLRKLWRLSKNPEIAAVVFQIKSAPASSLAHADEIDDAVQVLRASGKRVICHFEDAGGRALHACSHADRIVVNPAGGIRFGGLYVDRTYYGELGTKLGVRTQFVRIGEFKSAPEQYTNSGPSDSARKMQTDNLMQTNAEMLSRLAHGRKLTFDAAERAIASGPFTAPEALRYRLVDGYAYDDELETVASEVLGSNTSLREDEDVTAPSSFGKKPSVALVYVDGMLVDGRSQTIPFLDIRLTGSYTIADAIKKAREDANVSVVLLRVNSPGGSSMAADVIWREVELTARQKPVVVSMAGVAASGGYYIAVPAKSVFATPFTVTGSIGIYYGKADIAQLLDKIGVGVEIIRTSPHADAESIYRPFTPEEVKLLGGKIKQFYDVFVDRVARGRKKTANEIDSVARGRVWMGRDAQRIGLVDSLGGLRQALDHARKLGGLSEDAPIIELPPPEFSLLELASSLAGAQQKNDKLATALETKLRPVLSVAVPFIVFDSTQPMALCDFLTPP